MKGVRAESDGGRIRCVGSDASWDITIISSAGVGTGLPQGLRCGTLCKGLGISLIGEYCTNCKALYKDVSAFWRVMRNRLIFTSLSPGTEDYIVLRPLSHLQIVGQYFASVFVSRNQGWNLNSENVQVFPLYESATIIKLQS